MDRNAVYWPFGLLFHLVTFVMGANLALAQTCDSLLSIGDPLIEEARNLKAFPDFKILSDMNLKGLSPAQRLKVQKTAEKIEHTHGRLEAVRHLINNLYVYNPELLPVVDSSLNKNLKLTEESHQNTFDHIERTWSVLIRRTPKATKSSLLPLPNPFLIPGSRFQEGYYWDTFFTFEALISTGRDHLVKGMIENFVHLIKTYGLVPNGSRTYYLSRSQPPLLSQMIRVYLESQIKKHGSLTSQDHRWLKEQIYPYVKSDYENFWMNPETRYDKTTGLNHHWDSENTFRPERHSSDDETLLGETPRDVRAEAESGKDFTLAFEGQAKKFAGVMLNSLLFQVEENLSWMAELLNEDRDHIKFRRAANVRKSRIYKYLWDADKNMFFDYHLEERRHSKVVTADAYLPLYTGLVHSQDAQPLVKNLQVELERRGGLMSSNTASGKQWDAPYGWAPHQYFAISGLEKYQFKKSSQRIAKKWISTIDRVYMRTGKIIEKYDMKTGDSPIEDGEKYETQEGFAWTNGVYVWALIKLGVEINEIHN